MLERPWVRIEGTEEALRNLWKTLKSPKWPWGRHWEYWWGSCERLWSWHWGYVGSPERPCSVQKLNNQIYVHANSTFYMCWYRIHVYLIYVSWYPHYFIIWYCIDMIYIIVFVKKIYANNFVCKFPRRVSFFFRLYNKYRLLCMIFVGKECKTLL